MLLLLETILLLRGMRYSPSRRVRTLYCRIMYGWLESVILAASMVLLVMLLATS